MPLLLGWPLCLELPPPVCSQRQLAFLVQIPTQVTSLLSSLIMWMQSGYRPIHWAFAPCTLTSCFPLSNISSLEKTCSIVCSLYSAMHTDGTRLIKITIVVVTGKGRKSKFSVLWSVYYNCTVKTQFQKTDTFSISDQIYKYVMRGY